MSRERPGLRTRMGQALRSHRATALLFVLALASFDAVGQAGGTGSAARQTEGSEQLFGVSSGSARQSAAFSTRPSVGRSRVASLNRDSLGPLNSDRGASGRSIELNLFDDVGFIAVLEEITANPVTASHSWRGRLASEIEGTVQFTVRGRNLSGHVMTSSAHYVIEPLGRGDHIIYELNESDLPPDAEPLMPPRAERRASSDTAVLGTAPDSGNQIDVLVVYTTNARQQRGGTTAVELAIQNAIDWTNTAYTRSGINTALNLVWTEEVTYTESSSGMGTDLNRLTFTDSHLEEVHDLRDAHGADLVALITESAPYDYCGIAWYASTDGWSSARYGYSVTDGRCLPATFAHELGHNQGMAHDRWVSYPSNTFPYAYGYVGVDAGFRTIMAYRTKCGSCGRIQNFSNPDVNYNGHPTGVSRDAADDGVDDGPADNRHTLNTTRGAVANFRAEVGDLPAAPSDLGATVISGSQVDLTWTDNATTETGFEFSWRASNGTWGAPAVLAADTTSHSVTGLNPATNYDFQVRAFNDDGSSSYATITEIETTVSPPKAPSDFTAEPVTGRQADLTWTDNSATETSFELSWRVRTKQWVAPVAVAADAASYSVTGLIPGKKYDFQIRAINTDGASNYASVEAVVMPKSNPAKPTGLAANAVSSTQIDLTWTDNADDETGFNLFWRETSGSDVESIVLAADATSYSVTGLKPGNKYNFQIQATSEYGTSKLEKLKGVATPRSTLNAPTGLTATAVSGTQVDLTWIDTADNETGFELSWRKKGGSWGAPTALPADATSHSVTGLEPGAEYDFQIRAFNADQSSGYATAKATTTAGPTLSGPSGLTATTISDTQVNLAWTDNADNETGFEFSWRKSGGSWNAPVLLATNSEAYSVTGLTPGTTYEFRVRAVNAGAASGYASIGDVTTTGGAPAAPSAFEASAASGTQVNLTWKDNANNETKYSVWWRKKRGSWSKTGLPANTTSYSVRGLAPRTRYDFRIRATNGAGGSKQVSTKIKTPKR